MESCEICNTPLDPVWAEIGQSKHSWCVEHLCEHGETRGSRYCALCRYKNPLLQVPAVEWGVRGRRKRLQPA